MYSSICTLYNGVGGSHLSRMVAKFMAWEDVPLYLLVHLYGQRTCVRLRRTWVRLHGKCRTAAKLVTIAEMSGSTGS
jgi:hypothetical protein